jgi:hypothetical protein
VGKTSPIRVLTVVAIAAFFGLFVVLLVPGLDVYELLRYGVTDSEYCGGGPNTVVLGYGLGCDVDWRQIFVFSGMAWFVGTVLFLPFVAAVSLSGVLARTLLVGGA